MVYTKNDPINRNHFTNTPFGDERGNKAIQYKLQTEIPQCVYLQPDG